MVNLEEIKGWLPRLQDNHASPISNTVKTWAQPLPLAD